MTKRKAAKARKAKAATAWNLQGSMAKQGKFPHRDVYGRVRYN